MNNQNNISERLKSERIRLGLKQTDVIKSIDVAIATFSNYETGKRYPDADFLLKLQRLGYDLHYVFTGERMGEVASELSASDVEWLELGRKLSSEDRDRLIKMINSLI